MKKSFLFRKPVHQFVIRFFLIFGLVEMLAYTFPPHAYQAWLANLVGGTLNVPVNGIFLTVNGILFEISAFCTGLSTWGLLLGLIFGFSVLSPKKKIQYALLGWVFIVVLNVLRLLLIVWVGKTYDAQHVDVLHTLTWFVMSAFVLGAWYALLKKELKTSNPHTIAQSLLREK